MPNVISSVSYDTIRNGLNNFIFNDNNLFIFNPII